MVKQKFLRIVSQPQIAASSRIEIDLNDLRNQFEDNFNTLTITNTDAATAINIYLDGQKIAYVTGNNGVFSFDWELGLQYNFLSIENTSALGVIAADAVKIFVGRTGV